MVKKILVSLATITLLIGTSAYACNSQKKMCKSDRGIGYSGNIVSNVTDAVSKTGLSALQTKKIAEGISEYRETMSKVRKMRIFPIDSFINDKFDEKVFISEMSEKYMAKIAAKAALFKYVFAVLNDEQRKIFKREYAAPLINKMIRD